MQVEQTSACLCEWPMERLWDFYNKDSMFFAGDVFLYDFQQFGIVQEFQQHQM